MKIGIAGCTGKMGVALLKQITSDKKFIITSALTSKGNSFVGKDVGELIAAKNIGVIITDELDNFCKNCDVVIDFTSKDAMKDIILCAAKYGRKVVSGTTGITIDELTQLIKEVPNIAVLWSPNMSFGINLINKILGTICKNLDDNFDIEILETHHRNKLDSPSGTALMLGKNIAEAKNLNFEEVAVFDRHVKHEKRQNNQIGFSSIRAGNSYGKHDICFMSDKEEIVISHTALSRDIFASGALKAVRWIVNKDPGLYQMQDIFAE